MTTKSFLTMCYRHYFFIFRKVAWYEVVPVIVIGLFLPVIGLVLKRDFDNYLKDKP